MTKDNKINIKLEVTKDKFSGKLTIMAHFNEKASNVIIENNKYSWMPTTEERELLNEAFELIPKSALSHQNAVHEKISSPEPKIEDKPEMEPNIMEKTEPEPSMKEEYKSWKPDIEEESFEKKPPLEETKDPAIFKVTKEKPIPSPYEKEDDLKAKIDVKETDEPISEESEKNKEKDDGIMVEADAEAIEKALKKHDGNKDDSIVEADEKTIIDKVLNQKKKGRWSRK